MLGFLKTLVEKHYGNVFDEFYQALDKRKARRQLMHLIPCAKMAVLETFQSSNVSASAPVMKAVVRQRQALHALMRMKPGYARSLYRLAIEMAYQIIMADRCMVISQPNLTLVRRKTDGQKASAL